MRAQVIDARALQADAKLQAWCRERAKTKRRLPEGAYTMLQDWVAHPTRDMSVSTFHYIIDYFKGVESDRFLIGAADHGFTREELEKFKKEGKTARDVAKEVLARGVCPDAEIEKEWD